MTSRASVALLFGGRSGEHEVSVRSAASVARALSVRHQVLPVLIDHDGRWFLQEGPAVAPSGGIPVFLVPSPGERGALRRLADASEVARPDVYFPVLHGPFGEDGTIQGLLELTGAPYVGSGVAASGAGMDKALMKGLFAAAGLPQAPYRVLIPGQRTEAPALVAELGLPLFVKPANMGSSVGVSKVKVLEDLEPALDEAFAYDRKVVVEVGIDAREIEVSVLGNDTPEASLPGEIVPDREFYDYDSKYSSGSRTELRIPAPLGERATAEVRALAVRVFQAVDAAGLARIDFLLDRKTSTFFVNEINTMPGFTSISMFPKLWEATGLAYDALVARLVELARERHEERSRLRTEYSPRSLGA
jgi:D-alanine-D-alanine ligase